MKKRFSISLGVLVAVLSVQSTCFGIFVVKTLKPEQVKAEREKEEKQLNEAFAPWVALHGKKDLKPGESKKVFDKMMADWEQLSVRGNYTATVRLAEHHRRYNAKEEKGILNAINVFERALSQAVAAEEKKSIEGELMVTRLILLAYYAKGHKPTPQPQGTLL